MSEEYIFLHKPASVSPATLDTPKRGKKKSLSRKTSTRKSQVIVNNNDCNDPILLTFKSFEQKIDEIKKQIHENLLESLYENTNEYFNYYLVKRITYNMANLRLDNGDDDFLLNPMFNVIPTIALFTGINIQDYSNLFDNLTQRLRLQFTKHIFIISEKNAQNIKSLTSSLFSQMEYNLENGKSEKPTLFTLRYLINLILKENQNDAKVLFIFKQFELIPKETIENFVSLISCHLESLPIYFMFELASQTNILYEQLTGSVISKLCINRLYLMSPELYLNKFLTKLFIEQKTLFKLSGNLLKYLTDIYYDYNFSISALIHSLKYCFFDHLQNDSLNMLLLTSQIENMELYETVSDYLNSDNEQTKNISKILNNSNENKLDTNVFKIQNDWIKYNNQFVLICEILYEILRHFPSDDQDEEHNLFSINKKSFIDFYIRLCDFISTSHAASGHIKTNTNNCKKFTELTKYVELKNLLQIASTNTINEIVDSLIKLICTKALENQADYFADFLNELHDLAEILDKLKCLTAKTENICDTSLNENEENLNLMNDQNEFEDLRSSISKLSNTKPKKSSQRLSTRILGEVNSDVKMTQNSNSPTQTNMRQQQRKSTIVSHSLKQSTQQLTSSFRSNMTNWLESQFIIYFNRDYLGSVSPYSNHFVFKNLDKVKKRLFNMQRINIHNCLVNTNQYLNVNRLSDQVEDLDESPRKRFKNNLKISNLTIINETLIPLNIIYKIYLECGHMINLHDWLQAFVDKMENCDLKELNDSKRKLMQALFFRSITELQFMGYIKPTSRKVDHVVKLTNSAYSLTSESN